jgi:hypothetical protein
MVKNPTANAVLEDTHQMMSNMLCTADLQIINFTKVDVVLDDLITAVSFVVVPYIHESNPNSIGMIWFPDNLHGKLASTTSMRNDTNG